MIIGVINGETLNGQTTTLHGFPEDNVMMESAELSEEQEVQTDSACVVCGDVSDGLHFGVSSCRACAAFFRRTVSLKLEYTCRAEARCEIEKSARNMCRACRYQKCLRLGMLTSAVQQTRDGIGKRNSQQKSRIDKVIFKKKGDLLATSAKENGIWMTTCTGDAPQMLNRFSNLDIGSDGVYIGEMKLVPKMREGYQHFLSIRRATLSIAENQESMTIFASGETLRQSTFDSAKRVCKLEAHIVTDIVNEYFAPFKQLPYDDKVEMFKNFFMFFTGTDRAYQSYRMFGGNTFDDRLMMPDGGFIKMSELEKFYENSMYCKANPSDAARIFRPAMEYIVNVIVDHFRNIDISETEFVALLGLALWNDALLRLQAETRRTIWRTREALMEDLHVYYRTTGNNSSQISIKIGNLFLALPKIQKSVLAFKENFQLAELFNIFEADHCCKDFRPE